MTNRLSKPYRRPGHLAVGMIGTASLSFILFFAFITARDTCINPNYARFMGPEACPKAKN